MIQFFFTGASGFLQPQENCVRSLGGFISSTQIPNDYLNGLFSKISQFAQNKQGSFDMVCLAIKNTFEEPVSDVSIWLENVSQKKSCDFEASFVKPAVNTNNEQYFELIKTRKQKPFYGSPFKMVNLVTNKIVFDDPVLPNKYIGLWLKRNVFVKSDGCVSGVVVETIEKIKLNLSWL